MAGVGVKVLETANIGRTVQPAHPSRGNYGPGTIKMPCRTVRGTHHETTPNQDGD